MFTRIDFSKLSLMDALDLASLIEVEAFQRYKLFAAQLGQRDPSDAGSVFRSMANNEKKHGEQLAKRRQRLFGDAPATVTLDDLFDVEAPDVGSPRWDMSPRKAFEVALAAEQKAFAFYDQALPSVKEREVKALFEELRQEEAEHVRMVEGIIAKLSPEAAIELEDHDAD
jgi:rubrerythrin